MKKPIFHTEIAYFLGLMLLALGTALMVYGDFGMSMVLAPAYILHLFLSRFLPFFSFGVAEYALQAVILLLLMLIMRKVKLSYLLSFVATVFYGIVLDAAVRLTGFLPDNIYLRIVAYLAGGVMERFSYQCDLCGDFFCVLWHMPEKNGSYTSTISFVLNIRN